MDVRTPQSVRNGRVMVCVTTTFTTFTALEPADFVKRNCRIKSSSKRVSFYLSIQSYFNGLPILEISISKFKEGH